MKNTWIIILVLMCSVKLAVAQQYPETGLYNSNPYLINPGFTGYLTDLSGYAGARSPLSLDEEEFRSYRIGLNQSLDKSNIGIGGKLTFDKRAFFESTEIDFSLAYKVPFDNRHVISIGTDIGMLNRSYSVDNLSTYVDLTDPTLSSDYYYNTSLKIGLGLAYYSTNIEAGIAMPYLLEGAESFTQYFNIYFAYKHYFSNDSWFLKPNIYMVTYPDDSQIINLSFMVEKRDVMWIQLGATNNSDLLASLGFKFLMYELSYQFAHNLDQDALPYKSNSEILLKFHMGKSNRILSHIATKRNRKRF